MKAVIETERLYLRELNKDDFEDWCEAFQDHEVIRVWEKKLTAAEIREWLERKIEQYKLAGVGLLAMVEKSSDEMVGYCGLQWVDINGEKVLELAYLLKQSHRGKGYATEAGKACVDYAFSKVGVKRVHASIRPENSASIKIAERLGFKIHGEHVKNYNDKGMLHILYILDK